MAGTHAARGNAPRLLIGSKAEFALRGGAPFAGGMGEGRTSPHGGTAEASPLRHALRRRAPPRRVFYQLQARGDEKIDRHLAAGAGGRARRERRSTSSISPILVVRSGAIAIPTWARPREVSPPLRSSIPDTTPYLASRACFDTPGDRLGSDLLASQGGTPSGPRERAARSHAPRPLVFTSTTRREEPPRGVDGCASGQAHVLSRLSYEGRCRLEPLPSGRRRRMPKR